MNSDKHKLLWKYRLMYCCSQGENLVLRYTPHTQHTHMYTVIYIDTCTHIDYTHMRHTRTWPWNACSSVHNSYSTTPSDLQRKDIQTLSSSQAWMIACWLHLTIPPNHLHTPRPFPTTSTLPDHSWPPPHSQTIPDHLHVPRPFPTISNPLFFQKKKKIRQEQTRCTDY